MRDFLRFGLVVSLWIVGIIGVLLTFGTLLEAQRDGFIEPLVSFVIFGGGWGLLYLLYRYIGNHWDDMQDTRRSLVTLGCFAIFTGAGWIAWYVQLGEALVTLFYGVVVIALVVFFFAGGGNVPDLLGYGAKDREAERDANLRGISNALDDIKKKL